MQAVVLAGGMGTRLRPLTYARPKALIPLLNKPLILHILEGLPPEVDEVIIAATYKIEALEQFFNAQHLGRRVRVVDEEEPRGTGGALGNLSGMLSGDFLVYNGDVVTDLDQAALVSFHRQRRALATIALHRMEDPTAYGVVELDPRGHVMRFQEKPSRGEAASDLVNAGVYVMGEKCLEGIPEGPTVSLEREVFPSLARGGLFGYPFEGLWVDAGTLPTFLRANRLLLERQGTRLEDGTVVAPEAGILDPVAVGRGTRAQGGVIGPFTTLGRHCTLGRARISSSVLLDRVVVEDGAHIEGSILGEGCSVSVDARVEDSIVADHTTLEKGAKVIGERVGK